MAEIYKNIHQKLIDKCKKGDKKSQFKLYKLYYKAMFNTCCRLINDKNTAEDVMQEAFLSAFLHINKYDNRVSFGAWLKKITINKSLDYLKKKKIEFADLENISNKVEDQVENDDANIKYDIKKIYSAINTLDEKYRIVISLYLLEGYDHAEIAQILNLEYSTVRSQYSRAKRKLIENLKLQKWII